MTSTPLAPRSVSTPTHKDQREAWPCHSGLSPSLSLLSFYLSLSLYHPLPRGGGWRLGPSPLLMSLVRHMTMWSGGGDVTQTSSVTNSISDEKKAPLPLSWMVLWLSLWQFYYSWYRLFSADSSFSVVCRIRGSSSIWGFLLWIVCVWLFYFLKFLFDATCHFALMHNLFFADFWGGQQGLKRVFKHISHVVCLEISFSRTMYCMWTGG